MAATDPTPAEQSAIATRVESKVREFHELGEFAHIRDAIHDDIQQHFQALQAKVDAAARSGSTWKLIRAQFGRDVGTIFDHFLESLERLDAAEMRQHRKD